MAIMNQLRSPIPWIGGKHYSAQFIVSQFPPASSYDVFVDVFGGGASVLLTKPAGKHREVYNDLNGDLVNCWMHMRDQTRKMIRRMETLPYSYDLYYAYYASLFDGTEMDKLERAVRWYYVLLSGFTPWVRETSPLGWNGGITGFGQLKSEIYHSNIAKIREIAARLRLVEIHNRDFEKVIEMFERPRTLRTLLYCDPPYIDAESYYKPSKDIDLRSFHERLACVLNATPAMVALSYYEHPWLDELYPAAKWRRVTFETIKHSQRTKSTRDKATEVLLCNYSAPVEVRTLWDEE